MSITGGQAGAQPRHGPPDRRLPQELGGDALVLQVPPVPDDAIGQGTDLRRGQRMRVGHETAGKLIAQPGREDTKELRNGVLVAADDDRFGPAGLDRPFEQRGGVVVVVAGQLDDALVDPVRPQAVPPAEAVAAHPLGRRQHNGAGKPRSPAGSSGTYTYNDSSDDPAARISSSLSTSARPIIAPPEGSLPQSPATAEATWESGV